MASAIEPLECAVCLTTYNLSDRLPKALSCQHSICGQCVDQLYRTEGDAIKCPICRQPSLARKVPLNFGLVDVLRSLCEECLDRKQQHRCEHCKKSVCEHCLDIHAESVYDELVRKLNELDQIQRQSNDVMTDNSALEQEEKRESETITEIRQAISLHQEAVTKLGDELESEVTLMKQKNLGVIDDYLSSLHQKTTDARSYTRQIRIKVGLKYTKTTSIEETLRLDVQCQRLADDLTKENDSTPTLVRYQFTKACDKFDPHSIGKLTRSDSDTNNTTVSSSDEVTTENYNTPPSVNPPTTAKSAITDADTNSVADKAAGYQKVPDYKTLRYERSTGSKGSDMHEFDKPSHVLCTSDQIIVSDTNNNRIKFYDTELKLKLVIGEQGSGPKQFRHPTGMAIGPGGEIFVCDLNNHRIIVLSPQGEFVRHFGTKGSGDDQFKAPQGIAIRDDWMYIADVRNYRVKVVRTDGTFVMNIGSNATFKGLPNCVALLSSRDGRILVNELSKKQFHVYNRRGDYLGLFPASIPAQFAKAGPISMTVDSSDNVIISYTTDQLAVYTSEGDLITVLGSRGQGEDQFDFPFGVSVDSMSGRVVVCDKNNHHLQMFKFDKK